MIPKVIHYCWFGKAPLPPLAVQCIKSWETYFPDYEIIEWNESNFDVNIISYTKEAYNAKKYAFVSDYARFWILYNYGGIYFDTDVEVIQSLEDIIEKGDFMGCEANGIVAPGLGLGCQKGNVFYREILDIYKNEHFIDERGKMNSKTVVTFVTAQLKKYGLRDNDEIQCIRDINLYPKEYFCPKNYITGELVQTVNTRTVHHYSASWYPWYSTLEKKICTYFHIRFRDILGRIVRYF